MSETIIFLIALNVCQAIYWSIQVHRLVNKLMCRNFAEYNQIINPEPLMKREVFDFSQAREQEEILSELNGMLPS